VVAGGPTYAYDDLVPPAGRCEYEVEAMDRMGGTERFGPVAVDVPRNEVVRLWAVQNPARSGVLIEYTIPWTGQTDLRVFDVSGRVVRTLRQAIETAGDYTLSWDARSDMGHALPAGIYFLTLDAPNVSRRVLRLTLTP
jgi:hypothetical protein